VQSVGETKGETVKASSLLCVRASALLWVLLKHPEEKAETVHKIFAIFVQTVRFCYPRYQATVTC
jgi:hypothetical protein